MPRRERKVITVNTTDQGGGAEVMAWCLFKAFQQHGWESWMVVGDKKTDDPKVMPFFQSPFINYRPYGLPGVQRMLQWLKRLDARLGIEDFRFPYSKYLLTMTGSRPDLVHLHNLHGGYFDLRVLPALSRQVPVFLTLHDVWTMTGHCAYPLDCTRWRTGCGSCPHLDAPPALERDGSHGNWLRKRKIYSRSKIYLGVPTNWLKRWAEQSILAPAIVESRVIPCGLDLSVFKPACRQSSRQQLGIAPDVYVVVFVGNLAKSNPFKDYPTMRAAMSRLSDGVDHREIHFYCIGEAAGDERMGKVLIRHVPYQTSSAQLARYYQSADIYLHAAQAENFGVVIAEAMACGIPVVATRVGGISETCTDHKHGILVPPGNAAHLAQAVRLLLHSPELRRKLGRQAADHAHTHYGRDDMVNAYLGWFGECLESVKNAA